MIGISACLAGICCRYDGKHQNIKELAAVVANGDAVLICPEIAGGLSTPRKPAEIIGGEGHDVWSGKAKVVDCTGKDVTEAFKHGAIKSLKKLQELQINVVILKDASPSCGCKQIYDGSFSGTKISGSGVAAAYFKEQGLQVYSEKEWLDQQKKR